MSFKAFATGWNWDYCEKHNELYDECISVAQT